MTNEPNHRDGIDLTAEQLLDPTLPRRAVIASRNISLSGQPQRHAARTTILVGAEMALFCVVLAVPLSLVAFIALMIWTRTPHVPFWDEWGTVTMVQHATEGTLTWGDFWAFNNEHRIVIPRMLDLAIILTTHWNRQIEMSFDLALAVAEWALLLVSARRGLRSKALITLAIAPISLAVFTFTQYENWLWAFQITFLCTVFGVALCMWGLTTPRATWRAFAVTLIGAVVAALSSLGGLAVFIAFLPAIVSLGYKKTAIWVAVGIGIIVPYMQGFPHSVPVTLSLLTLRFCITYLGAPVGAPSVTNSYVAGMVSLALAVVNVLYYWMRERRIKPLLPWIGLGCFAIGLTIIISFGRVMTEQDLVRALTPRYEVFVALWWVGVIYLLLLNCKGARTQIGRAKSSAQIIVRLAPWITIANSLMLLVTTLGLVWANWSYIPLMKTFQYEQVRSEACIVNDEYATTPCLWNYFPSVPYLQQQVAYLRTEHFGIFSGNYQRLVEPAPIPSAHALVHYYNLGNGDNWITTSYNVNYFGPYTAEETLGYLYDQQQPGTHAMYTCVTATGHHFVSLIAPCAGGTKDRIEGWLFNKPMTDVQAVTLYDCSSVGNDAISTQPTCSGQAKPRLLGYALAQLP